MRRLLMIPVYAFAGFGVFAWVACYADVIDRQLRRFGL